MKKELIKCTQIGVNCVINDPVDVHCGGPQYFGFDFNVMDSQVDAMKTYIKATLDTFSVPFIEFTTKSVEVKKEQLWDQDRIFDCISDEADYLISQSRRNYKICNKKHFF